MLYSPRKIVLCRGASLAEVILSIGIILTLAGLMAPLLQPLRRSALEAVSRSNLKQLHSSLALYRVDYDGEGVWGSAEAMGLPPVEHFETVFPLIYALRPPLAPHPLDPEIGQLYWTQWQLSGEDFQSPTWADYSQQAQSNTVFFIDPFVTPADVIPSQGTSKLKLVCIFEGGHVKTVQLPGDWRERTYWSKALTNQ